MIDLHCHLLNGIDDGPSNLATSLEMARLAVADGITITACTPHIQLGVYDNRPVDIRRHTAVLQTALDEAGIALKLVTGADVHIRPDFVTAIREDAILTLNNSRYVLFEPPHHVAPPRMEDILFELLAAGYVPILTHPERLTWLPSSYGMLERLVRSGVWIQLTAGSLTGSFGKAPHDLALRMLQDGLVHILATDAHSLHRRPPKLSDAVVVAASILGADEAGRLVWARPKAVIENSTEVLALPPPIRQRKKGLIKRYFSLP